MRRDGKAYRPFWDSKGTAVLQHSYCALIDILGFTQMTRDAMAQGRSQHLFKSLKKTLSKSIGYYKFMRAPTKYFKTKPYWEYKFFTDNLVLGFPRHPNTEFADAAGEFGMILDYVISHQLTLALDGFFTRGAISFGELHMSTDVVFGAALLEAHDDEIGHADVPRIILSQSAVSNVMVQLGQNDYRTTPHNRCLIMGSDGRMFVNYLLDIIGEETLYLKSLSTHKEWIKQRIREHQNSSRILRKYIWLADYHNYFCHRFVRPYVDIRPYMVRHGAAQNQFKSLAEHFQPLPPPIHGPFGQLFKMQSTGRIVRDRKREREWADG